MSVDLTIEAAEIECNANNPISKELILEIDELKSKLNEKTLKNQKLEKEIAKNKPKIWYYEKSLEYLNKCYK